jgi:tetratricopeptide (TPR) repeat protein
MMRCMLFQWLNAKDAIEAGNTLADTFVASAPSNKAARDFMPQAAETLRSQKLNFYKRAMFANAFKWRLLENGVQEDTAAEVTQTLLFVSVSEPGATQVGAATAAAPSQPLKRKAADSLARQAQESYSRGAYAEAVEHYTSLITLRPRDVAAHNNLGACLSKLGRYSQAEVHFRKAIARQPNYPQAYINLATLKLGQGLFAEAEQWLRRALNSKPGDLGARSSLGQALALQGRLEAAREELDKVLRASPSHAEALYGMGIIAKAEGRFEEAEDFFKRALVSNPRLTSAWAALTSVRTMTASDKLWLKRAEQVADSFTSPAEESALRFAIGKYFNDIGNPARAFKSYARANELLKSLSWPYERSLRTAFVNDLMRVYTPETIARAQTGGCDSAKPIFVVGMMRSGTSLVEQILASHPAVGGAGELDFWTHAARKHDAHIRQDLLGEQTRRKLAQDYLRTLESQCPQAQHIVDKAPLNADYLGIIHSVFPQARILHMRRDPIDTCLSCYFQSFGSGLNFALDLSDLAHYYAEHARLMAHWHKVLPPGAVFEVQYEELVADPEHVIRRILEFLGLDWDERCLQFHRTSRPVLTASSWQVRQPMYRSSVQRWRQYSKFIGPLLELSPA